MLQAKTGAAFLALHTHAQVLPVALTGTERVWAPTRGWRVWHRPRVTLTFGEPFRPVAPAGMPAKLVYQAVADDMSRHVAALLPEAYRGYYATAPQPHTALVESAPPPMDATPDRSDAGLPHA
jgi:1-acyl-sn-glycerol-3-phosphate acyltransferase